MKPTKEHVEAYKAMAKEKSVPTMEEQIKAILEATCDKYKGNEDKFEGCINYLTDTARELLDGKNGDVPGDVCYRICRDYFNDEIWKQEEAMKAEETTLDKEPAPKAEPKKDEIKPEHGQMSFLDTLGV